ncbi:MAG: hypothetical protein ACREIQ_12795 [Nitrospiria bacterium]
MAKCVYCQQKKGKRSCPALKGLICSGCCGEHRGRGISCPIDCPYFVNHEAYQQGRLGALFFQERQHLYRELEKFGGQMAVQLLQVCDMFTYQYFHSRPGTFDWELLAGLEDVRIKLSPIKVQGTGPSAFGESLWKEVGKFCERQQVSASLAMEVVDHALRFFKGFSGSDLRSNRYLKGLIGFVDQFYPALASQIKERSTAPGTIILPASPVGTTNAN